jgi:hypothetical protein
MANWLPNLLHKSGASARGADRKARKASRFQPHIEALEERRMLSTFIVSTVADSGPGSLRQAIMDNNSSPTPNIIEFDIGTGVQRIYVNSALPAITNPVTIDGTTQPGFTGAPLILINGSGAEASANGLTIKAGKTTVKGLIIRSFGGDGIEINGAGGNTISGNYIGTDYSGMFAHGNGERGISIDGSSNNTIGGTAAGTSNIISGNGLSGVVIDQSSNNNQVEGNLIGTDATGKGGMGNGASGVRIAGLSANNLIGGTTVAARNVISSNAASGVHMDSGATNNQVEGNYIGTGSGGEGALGNGLRGIYIEGSSNNTIGGTASGAGNLISGNNLSGIVIDFASNGNNVQGNLIGTDAAGTKSIANGVFGVRIAVLSASNVIGGTTAAARNVISGNASSGVVLDFAATNNTVEGNYIGTDISGANALGNGFNGITLDGDAAKNVIGGQAANVIAFNGADGVMVGGVLSVGNAIQGNSIFSNGGIGIDLMNGGNTAPALPVLQSVIVGAATQITGTLPGTPNTTYTLNFYANTSKDSAGLYEGQIYLGSTQVTTDSTGHAGFSAVLNAPTTAGEAITATDTDPSGNTSEFSPAAGQPIV